MIATVPPCGGSCHREAVVGPVYDCGMRSAADAKFAFLADRLGKPLVEAWRECAAFDPAAPVTYMASLDDAMQRAVARAPAHDPEDLRSRIRELLLDPAFERERQAEIAEAIRGAKQRAEIDRRWSLLHMLVKDAEAAVPRVGMLLLARHCRPDTNLPRLCAPQDLIDAARSESGERRSRTVVRLVAEVSEILYLPYLQTLHWLLCVKDGRPLNEPPDFGALGHQLPDRLPHASLVHPRARLFRNACVHKATGTQYVPRDDVLLLRDENTPAESVAVDELLAAATDMYTIAGPVVTAVAELYCLRTLQADGALFRPAAFADVFSDDAGERDRALVALQARWTEEFASLVSYLQRTVVAPVGR
jgi:hypothetical protein